MITSLLDTDFYKFTMAQVVFNKFSTANVEYKFKCRNKGIKLGKYASKIYSQICNLDRISINSGEIRYLSKLGLFSSGFLNYLETLRLQYKFINVRNNNGELEITITGPWISTIWFEVPILSIVNEVYFKDKIKENYDYANEALMRKLNLIKEYKDLKFADFGTRRRASYNWQHEIIDILTDMGCYNYVGTSNVHLSMIFGTKPIGTMAHEYLQAMQGITNPINSQKLALETWLEVYRGKLGVALTDVLGINVFLRDFDILLATSYSGVRHDSGDPFIFGEKIIKHYENLKINPKSKTIIFSDGLTFEKSIELYKYFKDKINLLFAIGTNLTNDTGHKPLNIVIKMTKCNGLPVAKISDSPGKGMCENENYLNYLKNIFQIKGR